MKPAQLQEAVIAALAQAQKPLAEEDARAIALQALNDAQAFKEATDFGKWFDRNGAWLTGVMNRG